MTKPIKEIKALSGKDANKFAKRMLDVEEIKKSRKGFTVIMKDKTSSKEIFKLIEQIFKNKFVKSVEGTIPLKC